MPCIDAVRAGLLSQLMPPLPTVQQLKPAPEMLCTLTRKVEGGKPRLQLRDADEGEGGLQELQQLRRRQRVDPRQQRAPRRSQNRLIRVRPVFTPECGTQAGKDRYRMLGRVLIRLLATGDNCHMHRY